MISRVTELKHGIQLSISSKDKRAELTLEREHAIELMRALHAVLISGRSYCEISPYGEISA